MAVEEVARVEHVEEVKLCVDRDGSFHPGIVSCCAFLYHQLLQLCKIIALAFCFSRVCGCLRVMGCSAYRVKNCVKYSLFEHQGDAPKYQGGDAEEQ